ncbi:hypothetical protein OG978_37175 [Streptomyces sp. NBC_01591]|uniref:hypothetical protein n=1 Tax=Streptomyces sp. NBC_01591 TaxID=2975888 RepID=UPI002DDA6308|nr:hypothetical protein [Streptomyces sp. NBC_01591]WSD73606.1 hypothetical protein OG978_37175 [Streptomyces sp. NBC_01591]
MRELEPFGSGWPTEANKLIIEWGVVVSPQRRPPRFSGATLLVLRAISRLKALASIDSVGDEVGTGNDTQRQGHGQVRTFLSDIRIVPG